MTVYIFLLEEFTLEDLRDMLRCAMVMAGTTYRPTEWRISFILPCSFERYPLVSRYVLPFIAPLGIFRSENRGRGIYSFSFVRLIFFLDFQLGDETNFAIVLIIQDKSKSVSSSYVVILKEWKKNIWHGMYLTNCCHSNFIWTLFCESGV